MFIAIYLYILVIFHFDLVLGFPYRQALTAWDVYCVPLCAPCYLEFGICNGICAVFGQLGHMLTC